MRSGVPYDIDFMNSAPDFNITSLGEEYFMWVVRSMADLAIRRATDKRREPHYRWDAFLGYRAPRRAAGE